MRKNYHLRNWSEFDKFEKVTDKYMLPRGEGDTKASQIVTALNKLVYKFYNDGDVYDTNYEIYFSGNDLSSYANWLDRYTDKNVERILYKITKIMDDGEYSDILYELCTYLLDEKRLKEYEVEKEGSIYDCRGFYKCW